MSLILEIMYSSSLSIASKISKLIVLEQFALILLIEFLNAEYLFRVGTKNEINIMQGNA